MFRTLALVAASLLLSLLAGEAVLRLARVEASLERPSHPGLDWLVSDPLLGYRNRPGYQGHGWRIDSLGFRGAEVAEAKPPGTLRIVCIGDSGTFGMWKSAAGAPDLEANVAWDTYVDTFERTLRERSPRPVEVINAGVLGYTTAHGLRQLIARVLPLDPDVVTVRLGLNDYGLARLPAFALSEPRSALGRFLFYRGASLVSFRLAVDAYRRIPADDLGARGARVLSLEAFEHNLRRFADEAEAADIRLLFLDYPIREDSHAAEPDRDLQYFFGFKDPREQHALHAVYQQALQRVASERGVPVVETTAELARAPEPGFSPYDRFHPNDAGARRIGELLAERVLSLGWMEILEPAGR
jgi:lysophospholipase L1-like esterase